jgi:signal transduction histidine kinase
MMHRRRLTGMGLRWKLVLALVATSGVTLAAAMLAIVHPLERRLAEDQLRELRQVAHTTRVAVDALPSSDLRRGSVPLRQLARSIERRTGAHIAIYDAQGAPLEDPDAASLRDARNSALHREGQVREGVIGDAVIATVPADGPQGRMTIILRKPLRDQIAAVSVVRGALPVAAAVGLIVSLLLAAALSLRLLRRLERLRQGARRLAQGGIYEPLPEDTTADEVGDLARALEAMRLWLGEEERSRQAFLSTASHELRTPIASLQGTLELLEEDLTVTGSAAARKRAASALRQSRRLANLASDLLDLSRVDGGVVLRREPVDLHDLGLAMVAECEDDAQAAGVHVHVLPPQGAPWAMADPMAVARIVRLLLDNALRYGASGGEVTIVTEGDATRATVRVSDRGPGIAPEERERIFGRFERGSAGVERPGFGLGLPIARGLARLMGGDVRALDSAAGACIEIELPASPVPGDHAVQEHAVPLRAAH